MTVKEAKEITGGLSNPSKMPGKSYSLPPKECITGSVLRETSENSVCRNCYACKGRYNFNNVQNALYKRLNALDNDTWINAMSLLINKEPCKYFRWHDSGDLQSFDHLCRIIKVCQKCPDVKFRLPTKEYTFIFKYLKSSTFPDNLTVRLSAYIVDKDLDIDISTLPLTRSVVITDTGKKPKDAVVCPATTIRHQCGDCRKCWDRDQKCIAYLEH